MVGNVYVEWNEEEIKAFRVKLSEFDDKDSVDGLTFEFDGNEFLVQYARYLSEYFTSIGV